MIFVRVLAKRLLLSLITLWLLSVLVFAGGQLLPGDVGRAILGPLADARAVANLDHQLGIDRPLLVQYWDWISHFVTGDMGMSYHLPRPGRALHRHGAGQFAQARGGRLRHGGAARHPRRRLSRRCMSAGRSTGSSASSGCRPRSLPEFVSGIVLILIFGVWLDWLPITATWPEGSGPLTQIYYLMLPSLPLVLVLFGYIARMARAGTIEALDADYTRTAVLKGLPRRIVIWRHVLRNALLPTITVIATQVGYLIGGLVVVEICSTTRASAASSITAARGQGFPHAGGGRADRRHHLHPRDAARRSALFRAQSAHPLRSGANERAGRGRRRHRQRSPRRRATSGCGFCCAPPPS